ncbi:hypothetical protein predicted by Glimmer/Critica [Sorangium cellulosum So ce56]|uniref:Secreted protein n=2 Tax=Sorangium cellulosum TaxID=56 RepID=A9FD34_SORC5|nr:hypothetical protein predicted by Glimmer/Critica [Sorangium cellulosum So ce56]
MPISPRPLLARLLLASIAACAPAPPAVQPRRGPDPRRVTQATPPPQPPAAEPLPSAGCTDLPLPATTPNTRPMRPTKEQTELLVDADRLLAARPDQENDPAIRALARARALWGAGEWPEATRVAGEIAIAHPREDAGIVAAMLYLAGLNLLGSQIDPPRTSCHDELVSRLPILQRHYCERGEDRRHPSECYLLYKIERAVERGGGCTLPEKLDVPPSVAYARAGEWYLARAVQCVEATRLVRVSPLAEHCDDLAFYAVRAFMNVPDETRAGEARALLLEPGNGMLKSPHIAELPTLAPRRP